MDSFIQWVLEVIAEVWKADRELRSRSRLGESVMERSARRGVAWLCGGVVVVILAIAVGWWFRKS